jgi:hypothetical protein
MVQKVMSSYIASISKFKNDPEAILAKANGESVGICYRNEIAFYAVPAQLYKEIRDLVEFQQREESALNIDPAQSNPTE